MEPNSANDPLARFRDLGNIDEALARFRGLGNIDSALEEARRKRLGLAPPIPGLNKIPLYDANIGSDGDWLLGPSLSESLGARLQLREGSSVDKVTLSTLSRNAKCAVVRVHTTPVPPATEGEAYHLFIKDVSLGENKSLILTEDNFVLSPDDMEELDFIQTDGDAVPALLAVQGSQAILRDGERKPKKIDATIMLGNDEFNIDDLSEPLTRGLLSITDESKELIINPVSGRLETSKEIFSIGISLSEENLNQRDIDFLSKIEGVKRIFFMGVSEGGKTKPGHLVPQDLSGLHQNLSFQDTTISPTQLASILPRASRLYVVNHMIPPCNLLPEDLSELKTRRLELNNTVITMKQLETINNNEQIVQELDVTMDVEGDFSTVNVEHIEVDTTSNRSAEKQYKGIVEGIAKNPHVKKVRLGNHWNVGAIPFIDVVRPFADRADLELEIAEEFIPKPPGAELDLKCRVIMRSDFARRKVKEEGIFSAGTLVLSGRETDQSPLPLWMLDHGKDTPRGVLDKPLAAKLREVLELPEDIIINSRDVKLSPVSKNAKSAVMTITTMSVLPPQTNVQTHSFFIKGARSSGQGTYVMTEEDLILSGEEIENLDFVQEKGDIVPVLKAVQTYRRMIGTEGGTTPKVDARIVLGGEELALSDLSDAVVKSLLMKDVGPWVISEDKTELDRLTDTWPGDLDKDLEINLEKGRSTLSQSDIDLLAKLKGVRNITIMSGSEPGDEPEELSATDLSKLRVPLRLFNIRLTEQQVSSLSAEVPEILLHGLSKDGKRENLLPRDLSGLRVAKLSLHDAMVIPEQLSTINQNGNDVKVLSIDTRVTGDFSSVNVEHIQLFTSRGDDRAILVSGAEQLAKNPNAKKVELLNPNEGGYVFADLVRPFSERSDIELGLVGFYPDPPDARLDVKCTVLLGDIQRERAITYKVFAPNVRIGWYKDDQLILEQGGEPRPEVPTIIPGEKAPKIDFPLETVQHVYAYFEEFIKEKLGEEERVTGGTIEHRALQIKPICMTSDGRAIVEMMIVSNAFLEKWGGNHQRFTLLVDNIPLKSEGSKYQNVQGDPQMFLLEDSPERFAEANFVFEGEGDFQGILQMVESYERLGIDGYKEGNFIVKVGQGEEIQEVDLTNISAPLRKAMGSVTGTSFASLKDGKIWRYSDAKRGAQEANWPTYFYVNGNSEEGETVILTEDDVKVLGHLEAEKVYLSNANMVFPSQAAAETFLKSEVSLVESKVGYAIEGGVEWISGVVSMKDEDKWRGTERGFESAILTDTVDITRVTETLRAKYENLGEGALTAQISSISEDKKTAILTVKAEEGKSGSSQEVSIFINRLAGSTDAPLILESHLMMDEAVAAGLDYRVSGGDLLPLFKACNDLTFALEDVVVEDGKPAVQVSLPNDQAVNIAGVTRQVRTQYVDNVSRINIINGKLVCTTINESNFDVNIEAEEDRVIRPAIIQLVTHSNVYKKSFDGTKNKDFLKGVDITPPNHSAFVFRDVIVSDDQIRQISSTRTPLGSVVFIITDESIAIPSLANLKTASLDFIDAVVTDDTLNTLLPEQVKELRLSRLKAGATGRIDLSRVPVEKVEFQFNEDDLNLQMLRSLSLNPTLRNIKIDPWGTKQHNLRDFLTAFAQNGNLSIDISSRNQWESFAPDGLEPIPFKGRVQIYQPHAQEFIDSKIIDQYTEIFYWSDEDKAFKAAQEAKERPKEIIIRPTGRLYFDGPMKTTFGPMERSLGEGVVALEVADIKLGQAVVSAITDKMKFGTRESLGVTKPRIVQFDRENRTGIIQVEVTGKSFNTRNPYYFFVKDVDGIHPDLTIEPKNLLLEAENLGNFKFTVDDGIVAPSLQALTILSHRRLPQIGGPKVMVTVGDRLINLAGLSSTMTHAIEHIFSYTSDGKIYSLKNGSPEVSKDHIIFSSTPDFKPQDFELLQILKPREISFFEDALPADLSRFEAPQIIINLKKAKEGKEAIAAALATIDPSKVGFLEIRDRRDTLEKEGEGSTSLVDLSGLKVERVEIRTDFPITTVLNTINTNGSDVKRLAISASAPLDLREINVREVEVINLLAESTLTLASNSNVERIVFNRVLRDVPELRDVIAALGERDVMIVINKNVHLDKSYAQLKGETIKFGGEIRTEDILTGYILQRSGVVDRLRVHAPSAAPIAEEIAKLKAMPNREEKVWEESSLYKTPLNAFKGRIEMGPRNNYPVTPERLLPLPDELRIPAIYDRIQENLNILSGPTEEEAGKQAAVEILALALLEGEEMSREVGMRRKEITVDDLDKVVEMIKGVNAYNLRELLVRYGIHKADIDIWDMILAINESYAL